MEFIIMAIIWGIIWGNITNMILRNKGYNDNWFWWGFFFGFLATIVASTKTNQKVLEVIKPTLNTNTEANEIREYKKLLDEGIITKEEFEDKKKKILDIKNEIKTPELKNEIFTEEDYRNAQKELSKDLKDWMRDLTR